MTINQALDQLTQGQNLNQEQQDLRLSLMTKLCFGCFSQLKYSFC
jgi:hypothetical protein